MTDRICAICRVAPTGGYWQSYCPPCRNQYRREKHAREKALNPQPPPENEFTVCDRCEFGDECRAKIAKELASKERLRVRPLPCMPDHPLYKTWRAKYTQAYDRKETQEQT